MQPFSIMRHNETQHYTTKHSSNQTPYDLLYRLTFLDLPPIEHLLKFLFYLKFAMSKSIMEHLVLVPSLLPSSSPCNSLSQNPYRCRILHPFAPT